MASKIFTLTILLGAATSIYAAPMPQRGVDSSVLLQNGLEAQRLNTAFQSLSRDDSCQDDEVACIDGEGTICINGRWSVQERCAKDESCFALPLLESAGTVVTCANQSDALATFQAAGFDDPFGDGDFNTADPPPNDIGGSNDSNNSTSADNGPTNALPPPSSTDVLSTIPPNVVTSTQDLFSTTFTPSALPVTTTAIGGSDAPSATQTITQFIPVPISEGAGTTITLTPETTTISPEEASSILGSLTATTTSSTTALFSTITTIPVLTTTVTGTVAGSPFSTVLTVSAPGATGTSAPASSTEAATSSSPILTLTPARPTQSA